MVGDETYNQLIDELFEYCRLVVKKGRWPYVSFVLNGSVILSRDANMTREFLDPSMQCSVSAIRRVQRSLETNDLSECTLLSLFEPTILSFDVALWAGIKKFVWCINAKSAPEHYHVMNYSPQVYAKNNPGKIEIMAGLREKEALKLLEELGPMGDFVKTGL